ncbi:MAG: cytidine deaminase [bacterium]
MLTEDRIQRLIQAAREARERAYAPYSNFFVGAALETDGGRIFSGCNIENAAYGASMCAERVALFKAVSEGFTDFAALALVTEGPNIPSPCGACRQVLSEFTPAMPVIMANMAGEYRVKTVAQLLPAAFSGANLKGAGEK